MESGNELEKSEGSEALIEMWTIYVYFQPPVFGMHTIVLLFLPVYKYISPGVFLCVCSGHRQKLEEVVKPGALAFSEQLRRSAMRCSPHQASAPNPRPTLNTPPFGSPTHSQIPGKLPDDFKERNKKKRHCLKMCLTRSSDRIVLPERVLHTPLILPKTNFGKPERSCFFLFFLLLLIYF